MLAAAAMLAVAGCGSSSSGSADRPPQEQFARDAEAICIEASERATEMARRGGLNGGRNLTPEQVVSIRNDTERKLTTVDVPEERAAEYARFVGLIGLQTRALKRIVRAAVDRDRAAGRAAQTLAQQATAEQNAAARALGILACASG